MDAAAWRYQEANPMPWSALKCPSCRPDVPCSRLTQGSLVVAYLAFLLAAQAKHPSIGEVLSLS